MNLSGAGGRTFQGIVFVIISVIIVAIAAHTAADERRFVSTAQKAKGMVVNLLTERHDNKTRYRPEVQFTAPDGQQIKFRSSMSSSPPAYREGESVGVLFDPANPRKAEIDSFKTLWMGPLIAGLMGLLFLVIGGAVAAKGIYALAALARLKKSGLLLQTEFQRVDTVGGPPAPAELPSGTMTQAVSGVKYAVSASRRSRRYYQIVTLGADATGAKREFLSQPLGKDPSAKMTPGMHIGVYVDPQDYGTYYMELKDII